MLSFRKDVLDTLFTLKSKSKFRLNAQRVVEMGLKLTDCCCQRIYLPPSTVRDATTKCRELAVLLKLHQLFWCFAFCVFFTHAQRFTSINSGSRRGILPGCEMPLLHTQQCVGGDWVLLDALHAVGVRGCFKTQVTQRPATIYWIVMTRLGTPFYLITTERACRLAGDACQTTRSR